MGKVLLNTGKNAENSYYFVKLDIKVWSVEELCYVLKENAFLLDEEIQNKQLVEWLEKECQLKELAKQLYSLLSRKDALSQFVTTILEFTGYYGIAEVKSIEQTLKSSWNLSDIEKKKNRIDYFLKMKKYKKALLEYENLLYKNQEEDNPFIAAIYHNKGVALSGLFLFEQGAKMFKKAYELVPDESYFKAYLAATRMHLNDQEYIGFVAHIREAFDISIQLEKEVDAILTEWENGEELKELNELIELREEGNTVLYYEEIERRTKILKDGYRQLVAESV